MNKSTGVTMERRVKHIHKIMDDADFHKLCHTIIESNAYPCNNRGLFFRWRDVTLVKLCFYCGLRSSEALNLRWKDIDFEKMTIKVLPYFNKTKQETIAQLSHPAKEALLDFYGVCHDLGILFEFLFPSCETFQPISIDWFHRIFKKYAREAGILEVEWISDAGRKMYNYTPYSGRRWFGTEVFRKTRSDLAVKFMMRHKQLRSAEPYVIPTEEDLRDITKIVFSKK